MAGVGDSGQHPVLSLAGYFIGRQSIGPKQYEPHSWQAERPCWGPHWDTAIRGKQGQASAGSEATLSARTFHDDGHVLCLCF